MKRIQATATALTLSAMGYAIESAVEKMRETRSRWDRAHFRVNHGACQICAVAEYLKLLNLNGPENVEFSSHLTAYGKTDSGGIEGAWSVDCFFWEGERAAGEITVENAGC